MSKERPGGEVSTTATAGLVLVGFSAVLFGTTGTALSQVPGSELSGGVDPLSAGVLRLLIGGGALALVARRTLFELRPMGRPLILGAVAVAVYQLGFFWAVTETGVAAGTLVTIGVSPLASRLLGAIRHRPGPGRLWYGAAVVLIGGLVLLTLGSDESLRLRPVGLLVAALAGFAFASYTECGSVVLGRGASPDATMAVLFFGGGLLSAPLLLWRGVEILSSTTGLLVMGHLSLVTLTLAYMAFGRGLRILAPMVVTMITIVEPVVATALSVVVLDERLAIIGWIGAAMIVLGLPLVGLASRPRHRFDSSSTATVRP